MVLFPLGGLFQIDQRAPTFVRYCAPGIVEFALHNASLQVAG
jgi:hypothetical protein